jgi:hypothetical protein
MSRRFATAYVGYAVCALALLFFQWQVYTQGPIATIMIGLVLVPIAIGGTLAIGTTIGARSRVLTILGVSTVVVVVAVTLTAFYGWAGAWPFVTAIAHAYELLVLVAWIPRDV